MGYTLSGRIKRKSLKDNRVSFMVGDKWISAFTVGPGVSEELREGLRNLMEGDNAEFTLLDREAKDGKVYSNIIGVTKVMDINQDVPAPPANVPGPASVHPVGPSAPAGQGEGPTRVRSMALAYAKDWAIGQNANRQEGEESYSTNDIIEMAKRFEAYILTGD